MLLRSIHLEGWRRFANPITVAGLSAGLNVLHGPNGCGKSTLMMALVRALFDSHLGSGQDVEALRPWGRDLSPQVTLEFEQEASRYRLVKGFLERKGCELSRWEQGKFARFKEGRAADDFLRSLFSGEEVKRGTAKVQHWGLAQMLWVPQGKLEFTELSSSAQDVLQQALDAQLVTTESSEIENRIAAQYNAVFTAQGRYKSGANALIPQLESDEKQAREKLAKLRETLVRYEAASRRMDDLRQQAEQASASERELSNTVEKTRLRVQEYVTGEGAVLALRRELETCDVKLQHLQATRAKIQQEQAGIAKDDLSLAQLRADHPHILTAVNQCDKQVRTLRQAADAVRAQLPQIDLARQHARDAQALTDAKRKQQELADKLATLRELEMQLQSLRDSRSKILSPTSKQLVTLRKSQTQLREARLRLEAALITLTIEPENALHVECLQGDVPGPQQLAAGATLALRGSPEVAIRIPGVGVMRAAGPAVSVQELRAELLTAEREWQKNTAPFADAALEVLEQAAQDAAEVDRQLADKQGRWETVLGSQTREQLIAELALATNVQQSIVDREPAWSMSPPDAKSLQMHADKLEFTFRQEIQAAEAAVEVAQTALQTSTHQLTQHDAEIQALTQRLEAAHRRLQQLRCDGPEGNAREDTEREQAYQALLLQRDTVHAKHAQAQAALQAIGEDPRKELAQLEKQASALRTQAAQALEQLHREDARLQQLASEAPYSAVVLAEEELQRVQEKLTRERLAAEAIKLLYDTLTQAKREVTQAVIEPVKKRTQQSLQRILGNKFEQVAFGDKLLPEGISPQYAEGLQISLEHLSGGEREQVYFAVRLALAEIAFPQRGELIVLDDVFVYTDSARIARIATLLEEMAERFQIILLTCHPERYRGLEHAQFFDVEQLALAEA
jgi:DNA repair exonuclease SbcCD ATPase subunit